MSQHAFRCHCLVPGCNRTKGVDFDPAEWSWEWICAVHWKLASMTIKRRRTKFKRRLNRLMAASIEVADSGRNDGAIWLRDPVVEPPQRRWLTYATAEKGLEHMRLSDGLKRMWSILRGQVIEKAMGI